MTLQGDLLAQLVCFDLLCRGWNSEEDARSEESSWEQRSTSSEIAHGSRYDNYAADGVIENIDDESLGLIIDGLQVQPNSHVVQPNGHVASQLTGVGCGL